MNINADHMKPELTDVSLSMDEDTEVFVYLCANLHTETQWEMYLDAFIWDAPEIIIPWLKSHTPIHSRDVDYDADRGCPECRAHFMFTVPPVKVSEEELSTHFQRYCRPQLIEKFNEIFHDIDIES